MIDPSGTCTTITNAHQYALTNTIHPHNCPRWQQEHKQLCAMSPQCFTPPPTDVQSTSLQLQFLNTPYANTSKDYHNNFTPMYTPSTPITKKRNKTHAHDEYLYHRWNNNTTNTCIVTSTTMPKLEPRTNNTSNHTHKQQSSGTTTKDDLSTTHTLDTSCTLDTSDPKRKTAATDMLINFTIWNQPIVQY